MRDVALLTPHTRPQLTETWRQHPTPPCMSPWPPWASPRGQRATDHRPSRHLAARPTSTPWTNSPRQFCPSPTVQCTPTMPARCQRAAQSAQSMPLVLVHLHPVQLRSARTPARHRALDVTPPSPCTAMHRHAPTAHRFPPATLKPPVPRLNRPATDTVCLSPKLGSRCRPSTPPTTPNRVR
jgi:hypothetical protein